MGTSIETCNSFRIQAQKTQKKTIMDYAMQYEEIRKKEANF